MSDAGGAEGEVADLAEEYGEYDFFGGDLDISLSGPDTSISEPSSDLGYGAGKGSDISLGDFGLSLGGGRSGGDTPELRGLLTAQDGGGTIESPVPRPEAAETKSEKPVKEKKPLITRAKRRRSLLTEAEGGTLRKPTVYRRSILGRP